MRVNSTPYRVDQLDQAGSSQEISTGPVAPHAITTRWTRTVPTGDIELILALNTSLRRVTVAAPAGRVESRFAIDGSARKCALVCYGNVVNDGNDLTQTINAPLRGGDVYSWLTADASTGGTVDYDGASVGINFDRSGV